MTIGHPSSRGAWNVFQGAMYSWRGGRWGIAGVGDARVVLEWCIAVLYCAMGSGEGWIHPGVGHRLDDGFEQLLAVRARPLVAGPRSARRW